MASSSVSAPPAAGDGDSMVKKKKGLRLFRSNNNNSNSDSKSEAQTGSKGDSGSTGISKAKSKVRKLVGGGSKKSKHANKNKASSNADAAASAEAAASTATATFENSQMTTTVFVTPVQSKNGRKATGTPSSALQQQQQQHVQQQQQQQQQAHGSNNMFKVVLLLMDPESCRFELLQLEFDAVRALVVDALVQIPLASTDAHVRSLPFTGLCHWSGQEMNPSTLLSNHCTGNDVLVAIPQGLPAADCAKLAKPILSDNKVYRMLLNSGIDVQPWKTGVASPGPSRLSIGRGTPSSSTPTNRSRLSSANESLANNLPKTADGSSPVKRFLLYVAVLVTAFLAVQMVHRYISAPIRPGDILSHNAVSIAKCGVFTLFDQVVVGWLGNGYSNPYCEENAWLAMNETTGIVSLTAGKDQQLVWEMKGGVCEQHHHSRLLPSLDNGSHNHAVCGLEFKHDGSVMVGGELVEFLIVHTEQPDSSLLLSPWPFAQKPNVQIYRPS